MKTFEEILREVLEQSKKKEADLKSVSGVADELRTLSNLISNTEELLRLLDKKPKSPSK